MIDMATLQASITLDADPKVIKHNRQLLKSARISVEACISMIDALSKANERMCAHSSSRKYMDYGGGSNVACDICGGQW